MIEQHYINKLKQSQKDCTGDAETMHAVGEAVMLELLREVGFALFASAYEEASKEWWYA